MTVLRDLADRRRRGAAYWEAAAPGWVAYASEQEERGAPLGAAAVDLLALRSGERVVDLGCAAGGTTAELASRVGPAGAAVGVDLSPELVAAARRRFPGLEFVTADVETVDELPGAPYDAALARMVLMLLADPVAGCATVLRSLRPGGRLAGVVFRTMADAPWMPAALLGAAPHLGPMPPMPMGDEPGPFALADRGRCRAVLTDAGFTAVEVTPHDVVLMAPDDPDGVAAWLVEVGPAGAAYRAADEVARGEARAGAARLLEPFRAPGEGYRLPTGIWTLSGRRPS